MKVEQVRKLPPFERLVYWITERESIRLKKGAGEPLPWTDDEILSTYRFCNVRRMDDKVSQWLLKKWYVPYHGHENMLIACALARHFNLPSALNAIGFPVHWDPNIIKSTLRGLKASGQRIFNGAYMVRGIGTADKTEMVVDKVCQPLYENPPILDTSSMQRSVEALLPYWGFSTFMAGQVVADLRHAVQGTWKDRKTWAPVGPGSARGMNRLHDRDKNDPAGRNNWVTEFQAYLKDLQQSLPVALFERLEAIDCQSVLCEYDKYTRALTGEGKPKQLYRSGA